MTAERKPERPALVRVLESAHTFVWAASYPIYWTRPSSHDVGLRAPATSPIAFGTRPC